MQKIFISKSIEEAKQEAVSEFGVEEEKITFEVLEEPKRTLFGKTKGEARVSAIYEPSKIDIACGYIKKVVKDMGLEVSAIDVIENENGTVLDIKGENIDEIIGKHGDTLDSIQYLTSLVCNKQDKDYFRISLDCCNYRAKRKEQLENLARKIARGVIKSGRSTALEPMNPYERRIIHSVISETDGVESHSVGVEPYRKVIVTSTLKRPVEKKDNKKNNRNGNNFKKKKFDISTSFEKDYKKPLPEDNLNSGLYSKIEF